MRDLHPAVWRKFSVWLFLLVLALIALRNVFTYHDTLGLRLHVAQGVGSSIEGAAGRAPQAVGPDYLAIRWRFYKLLQELGRDKLLHSNQVIGIVVADPEFYRGAYIDRPIDTVLDRCAIQPFSIPAFTGLPLLSALGPGDSQCRYESYGYQYLPPRTPIPGSGIPEPCVLATARGFRQAVVIDRHENVFSTIRIDCGAS